MQCKNPQRIPFTVGPGLVEVKGWLVKGIKSVGGTAATKPRRLAAQFRRRWRLQCSTGVRACRRCFCYNRVGRCYYKRLEVLTVVVLTTYATPLGAAFSEIATSNKLRNNEIPGRSIMERNCGRGSPVCIFKILERQSELCRRKGTKHGKKCGGQYNIDRCGNVS